MIAKILACLKLLILGYCPLVVRGQDADYWLNKGMNATEQKDHIEYFTKAIELKPSVNAYLFRGAAYEAQGEYALAEADYSNAIKLDTSSSFSYFVRSTFYSNTKQYDKELADISKQIEISPNCLSYDRRGQILKLFGRYEDALSDFSASIELNLFFGFPYVDRGLVYIILSEYDSALADFKKAISLKQEFERAYGNIGYVYLQQNKPDLAIENFNKCLSFDDKSISANVNLAIVYYMQGDKPKAKSYLDRAKELEPRLQNGMDGINALMDEGYYWTERDKETMAKMFAELK